MPRTQRLRSTSEQKLPSPWLEKSVNGIQYWVHVPTRRCGIHIRGLARLCGVTPRMIRSAIQNAQKTRIEVGQTRATELAKLLEDKVIFLEEVSQISPSQQGGPVKVICSDASGIFIRYYAKKGRQAAMESALKFMDFGIEQFIYTQVGFIPRPESVVLDDIEYLIAKETVQVTKSRQEEARFFTNPVTGECGIALQSLSFLCGGVALKHVEAFLQAKNDPFLQEEHPEPIVKAPICAEALHHFGYERKPRKSVAQHWAQALEPIVPTLHQKTHYQAPPPVDREVQLERQLSEAQKEISRLRQLAKQDEVDGLIPCHRLMGRVLEDDLPLPFWEIRFEVLTTKVAQYLDALILKRANLPPAGTALPDGLRADVEFGLLTYKSQHESLTAWAIQELISHYTGYRKELARQENNRLPESSRFQLYAVATSYPEALAKNVGNDWQATEHAGVYRLFGFELSVIVIVTSQIPAAPHNRPWNLLSHHQDLIRYALHQKPLPADLQNYFDRLMAQK